MKKAYGVTAITGALLFFCLCSPLQAQIQFGFKGGINLSNIVYKIPVENAPDILPTFQIGAVGQYDFREAVALGVGIHLYGKGYQYTLQTDAYKINYHSNPLYIQVPVQLILHGDGVYGAIGPYFGLGIAGKERTHYNALEDAPKINNQNKNLNFGNADTDDFSAYEIGGGVEFGYESKTGLRVTLNYQVGFTDLRPQYYIDEKMGSKTTSNTLSLCVAYMFKPWSAPK